MRMYDIILKKRNGIELNEAEIGFFVEGFTKGEIPDYQAAALMMAIYFKSMTETEIVIFTQCMAKSGDMIDLSVIDGIKVDKHSTGGVGDKTTLIVAPIVASCGVKVAKMSGRGLGHTGGTIDKLESIEGFNTQMKLNDFIHIVNKVGICVAGQMGNLVPADKKLYALRDVTATVDNIPLIASSIMSKKLASGANAIVLDVKYGSGAFMKTQQRANELAEVMVKIGKLAGKKITAVISNMDIPLGHSIGNSLEIIEAIDVLKNNGDKDLVDICIALSANMLFLAEKGTMNECEQLARNALTSGLALLKLKEWISAQGGNKNVVDNIQLFKQAKYIHTIEAKNDGYIYSMDTTKIGTVSMLLGAGRETKDSVIDYSAGIILHAKTGESIKHGDKLATLYTSIDKENIQNCEAEFLSSITIV